MTQCIGKKRYESERSAQDALAAVRSDPVAWRRPKVPRTVYRCDLCQGWHMSSMTGKATA